MRALLGIILAATAFALGGCTAFPFESEDVPDARFDAIDELGGAYGGVGIGSSPNDIVRVFGKVEPLIREGPFQPTGAGEFRGPTFIRSEVGYAYEDVLFWLAPNDAERPAARREVAGFQVTSAGARTARGIEVGDDLDDVRTSYPEIRCGDAAGGNLRSSATRPFPTALERWCPTGGSGSAAIRSPISPSRGRGSVTRSC